ncbi:hypothetical protein TRP8649_02319 [Pelagimonas phthalicica]|uniref:Uncharacterized protein n=1 Tax=Pelagimonas phthalicica TaxID=1037362 RepID=A0A238JDD7_9RHOB|nr:hypothetical protein [Pelagimonas phthalicica]TDS91157.1 hypothetical protein CLV87_2321 [Pelagimonas phthalicica]SMX28204.1 hypothetical protein TRP8649_02319 [Pelagimonas phthalicica]
MGDIFQAFFLHFLNGITFEFADDLLCWAGDAWFGGHLGTCRATMTGWANHSANTAPYAAFAGTLLGYAVSPLSVIVAWFVGKPKSPGDAFWRAITLELIEGVIAVIGQVITDQNLGVAMWSLGLSAVIAPIRGCVSSFTYAWSTSVVFKFFVLLSILTVAAIGLARLGLLPL